MTLPDFELVRPRPTDGLDPLSGSTTSADLSPVGFKTKPTASNQGFTPQPPAGIDLSVIDPLPIETGHQLVETETE